MLNEWLRLRDRLIFKTPPAFFKCECQAIRNQFSEKRKAAKQERRNEIADILCELTIDIQSYLKRWQLQKDATDMVTDSEIKVEAHKNCQLLYSWGEDEKVKYIHKEMEEIQRSNFMKLSRMTDEGKMNNRWGNDYASGLTKALRKGAVLVTTNPMIINNERKQDPKTWNAIKEDIKKKHPNASPEQLASIMTIQVVLKNCWELRPIYDASEGRYGYVSLQVSPRNSTDSNQMINEVIFLYNSLKKELGGEPNVVFKLPGTKASIEAANTLTSRGIGVNITLNFSIDQQIAFAAAIENGCARVSFVVIMTGRLDDPIRDELAQFGLKDAAEIAKWASTAVIRKAYSILYKEKGYKKSAILAASLRGPWNIEGCLTDGNVPIFITSFPDKTDEYDSIERMIDSKMDDEVAEDVMIKLRKSSIFNQAYNIGGLTVDGFDSFHPVVVTLNAFIQSYDEFLVYLSE